MENGVLEERVNGLRKEVDNVPNLMKQLENSFANKVDFIITTQFKAFDDKLDNIMDFIKTISNKIDVLEKNDHAFDLKFKDVVMNTDFVEYKKEMRDDNKELKSRLSELEEDKSFLTGSFGTLLKIGGLIIFLLSVVTLSMNIANGYRSAERAQAISKEIQKLEK